MEAWLHWDWDWDWDWDHALTAICVRRRWDGHLTLSRDLFLLYPYNLYLYSDSVLCLYWAMTMESIVSRFIIPISRLRRISTDLHSI